jgi:Fe-S cluster assembly scaffold protein SufB
MQKHRKVYIQNSSHRETVGAGEAVEIYVLAEKGDVDISVRHAGSDSKSSVRIAGVAEKGLVSIRMGLAVDPGLSNVEADQDARIILAGGSALISPWQDIRSEDVRARHGASVSGITPEAVWPLALAGIDRARAEEILSSSLRASVLDTSGDAC